MVTGNTKQVVTKDADTTVVVYGYGSTNKPFYKEAKRVKANSDRWFLILDTPVPCGQKLLLISGRDSNPIEAEIVTVQLLDAQVFALEVKVTRYLRPE